MSRIIFILIFTFSCISPSLKAIEISEYLEILDLEKTTSTSQSYYRHCLSEAPENTTLDEENYRNICQSFANSPLCESIEAEERVSCTQIEENEIDVTSWDFISSCGAGIWKAVKEMAIFLKDAVVWLVTDSVAFTTELAKKLPEQASDFYESVRNYFTIEWQKAMDDHEGEAFQKAMASKDIFQNLMTTMMTKLTDKIKEDFNQLGCYKPEYRSQKICESVAYLTLPPSTLFASLFLKSTKFVDKIMRLDLPDAPKSHGPDLQIHFDPYSAYGQAEQRASRTYRLSGQIDSIVENSKAQMQDLKLFYDFETYPIKKAEYLEQMKEINNYFVNQLHHLYSEKGIKTSVDPSPKEEGVLVLNIVPKDAGKLSTPSQRFFERVEKYFGGEQTTISLYENTMSGANGFKQNLRIEVGVQQAVDLPMDNVSSTARHEARHLMLDEQRKRGIDSIYNQDYHAGPRVGLDGTVESRGRAYGKYMSAQEVYTFSHDVGTHSRELLRNLRVGNHAKSEELLGKIKKSSKGVVGTTEKAIFVTNRNEKALLKALEWIDANESKGARNVLQGLKDGKVNIHKEGLTIEFPDGVKAVIKEPARSLRSVDDLRGVIENAIFKQRSLNKVAATQNSRAKKLIQAIDQSETGGFPPTSVKKIADYATEFSKQVNEGYRNFTGYKR